MKEEAIDKTLLERFCVTLMICYSANLSEIYFTRSQDRYIKIRKCGNMAAYLGDVVKATSLFSYHLQKTGDVIYPPNVPKPLDGIQNT